MKQIKRISDVGEYTDTREYEANEIYVRLDSLQSE